MSSRILIYGGSGGVGSATARLLRQQGHAVHLVARQEAPLAAVAAELGCSCTVGDVCDPELFSRTMADFPGELHGLVYAVGTINLRGLGRLKAADFMADYQINAVGAALAVQAALPAMKRASDGASVVLYSSVAANQGFAFHASIGMAKAAISGLTLSLAAELAPRIRVNAIAPSLTDTPLAAGLLTNPQSAATIAGMHALQRLGTPQDIANLTAFLLSDASSWMTGQILQLDGGRSTLRCGA